MKQVRIHKIVASLVLSVILLLQTFPKTLVIIDYYMHTAEYAALCVNKMNPEMHCNGTCQMDKKLQKVGHSQSKQPQQEKFELSIVYIPVYHYIKAPIYITTHHKSVFPPLSKLTPKNQPHFVFRPPQLLV